ncbi:unnamed protein product [Phytophthora lilii]|uniref:Unnamed protein product n=1 Tax=Phytophthora lilii TaxID=2077276 RepID=A0A9W6UEF2_9STRA|nr:unnamed protein product [Phytophthora lilii]
MTPETTRGRRPSDMDQGSDANARMLNLRFCIAYQEAAMLLREVDDDSDAAWRRKMFRAELANFHQLVVHDVTHEQVMAHARASLRLAWQSCDQPVAASENWARISPEDVEVGVTNDLQLVAPGVWIGSSDTLAFPDLLDERNIQHTVYCSSTLQDTRLIHEDAKISPPRSHHVVELFDLPRQQFEDANRDQLVVLSASSCSELRGIANSLSSLLGTPCQHALLLYCDSGISTSIATCAALLMARFDLPLELAMALLRAARRDILPSSHLHLQLQQLDCNAPGSIRHE